MKKSHRHPPASHYESTNKDNKLWGRPVESLAGTAPGPVPRTDPPSATGQKACKENNVGQPNQKPKLGQGKKPSSLNILQFNLDGFSKKKTELAHFLDKHNIHIATLQETQKGKNTDFHITGYTPTHCDCKSCQGTITYIRNDVTGKTTNQPESSTCIQKSVIWHSGRKFNIMNIYILGFFFLLKIRISKLGCTE